MGTGGGGFPTVWCRIPISINMVHRIGFIGLNLEGVMSILLRSVCPPLEKTLKTNAGNLRGRVYNKSRVYQKPYSSHFDLVPYPTSWRTSDFVKVNGEDNRTTWEHISQYLAQLSEVGSVDGLHILFVANRHRFFSLSLIGTAFSWFSSLSPNSIDPWEQLECKFHDHFYSPENDLKLSDITSVRQDCDESVNDYIRRFRDTKN
jgi:hypothetical protein